MRGAALGNAELSRLWRANLEQRRTVQARFVRALRTKAALRRGLGLAAAIDVCTLMLSPDAYQVLVGGLRWTHQRWVTWTTGALRPELLPPAADS